MSEFVRPSLHARSYVTHGRHKSQKGIRLVIRVHWSYHEAIDRASLCHRNNQEVGRMPIFSTSRLTLLWCQYDAEAPRCCRSISLALVPSLYQNLGPPTWKHHFKERLLGSQQDCRIINIPSSGVQKIRRSQSLMFCSES